MHTRRYSVKAGVLVVTLLVSVSSFSQEHLPAVFDTPIPRSYFGLHIRHPKEMWPDIPVGGWRVINIPGVVWRNVEAHGRKQWGFQNPDELVDLAEKHNVPILYTLGFTPTWASARPNEMPGPGAAAEPKDIQDWRDFVQFIANRYKGRILDWEIWNEANDKAFFSGSRDQMIPLAQAAYQILKQVDPHNTVISPSVTYGIQGTAWLDGYLRAGGGKYADVISYHLYTTPQGPEEMAPLIQKIRSVMAANGVGNKPLWNTETGWYIQNKAGDVKPSGSFNVLSSAQGGSYAIRSYVLAWAAGVSRFYWYTWDGQPMSLLEPDGTPKGAGVAFAQGVKWLSGAVMKSCDSDASNTWICHITRDGGYNGYIVWNTKGAKDFSIPTAWNVQNERDMYTHSHTVRGARSTTISIEPILLETKTP